MPVAGLQMNATGASGGGRSETPTMARAIVHAEGLAARASERLEVDLYAVVPPQIGVRGGPTCGKDPPDDIACVVNVERLTNSSRWIEVGQRSRRAPTSLRGARRLHRYDQPTAVPSALIACARLALPPRSTRGLHASVGAPNKGSRDEEIVTESESDDRASLD